MFVRLIYKNLPPTKYQQKNLRPIFWEKWGTKKLSSQKT